MEPDKNSQREVQLPAPQQGGANLPSTTPTNNTPLTSSSTDSSSSLSSTPTSVPATTAPKDADEADVIEKEWVLKAKAIVEHTREDPYKQNQEMSKFKADYVKKRYNKDLKVSDE